MKSRDAVIVDYKYNGKWKHTGFILEYDGPEFFPTGNEKIDGIANNKLIDAMINSQKTDELSRDNIVCFNRILRWEKGLEEINNLSTDDLRGHVTVLCVVNEELYEQWKKLNTNQMEQTKTQRTTGSLSNEALEARKAYQREYYKKNREKKQRWNREYWERKATGKTATPGRKRKNEGDM